MNREISANLEEVQAQLDELQAIQSGGERLDYKKRSDGILDRVQFEAMMNFLRIEDKLVESHLDPETQKVKAQIKTVFETKFDPEGKINYEPIREGLRRGQLVWDFFVGNHKSRLIDYLTPESISQAIQLADYARRSSDFKDLLFFQPIDRHELLRMTQVFEAEFNLNVELHSLESVETQWRPNYPYPLNLEDKSKEMADRFSDSLAKNKPLERLLEILGHVDNIHGITLSEYFAIAVDRAIASDDVPLILDNDLSEVDLLDERVPGGRTPFILRVEREAGKRTIDIWKDNVSDNPILAASRWENDK